MFPCCGYDPGIAAYLAAIEDFEHRQEVDDERSDRMLYAACNAAIGLCYGLLFMVT